MSAAESGPVPAQHLNETLPKTVSPELLTNTPTDRIPTLNGEQTIEPELANMDANKQTDTHTQVPSDFDPFGGLSFKVGVAETKNSTYRSKMEDVHTYIANYAERVDWGYFAVFDGHAGKESARWCGNNLHLLLEQEIDLELQNQSKHASIDESQQRAQVQQREQVQEQEQSLHKSSGTSDGSRDSTSTTNTLVSQTSATGLPASTAPRLPINGKHDMREHLYRAFVKADEMIEKNGQGSSGCTAAVAVLRWESETEEDCMIDQTSLRPDLQNLGLGNTKKFDFVPLPNHKRMLYTSNVGDSRIVLCREGNPYRLTYDHKASDENEINRIENSGGLILKNRVNGVLAVSRSLGDTYMKDLVLGKPFTTSTEIVPEDEFMIIACDGVWDVLSDSKACRFVSECFKKGNGVQETAKKLCQLAIDNSTTDNVTVMIIKLDNGVFTQQK